MSLTEADSDGRFPNNRYTPESVPPETTPISDLDMTDILKEVFQDYLNEDEPFKPLETTVTQETEPEVITVKPKVTFAPLDMLSLVTRRSPPSEVMEELIDKLNLLKGDAYEDRKEKEYICTHLPQGFASEEFKQKQRPCQSAAQSHFSPRYTVKEKHLSLVFDPPQIIFDHYKVGSSVKKTCVIRNEGKKLIKGRLLQPAETEMSLSLSGNISLSCGLPLKISVIFTPANLDPLNSSFTIVDVNDVTDKRTYFKVPIIAKRSPPELTGFKYNPTMGSNKFLNCGLILVGQTLATTATLTNVGSVTTFSLHQIHNDEDDTPLIETEFNPFVISPAKFTLKRNEEVNINIEFHTNKEGKIKRFFKILLDDNTEDYFDIIGNGISFQRSVIQFNNLKKEFPVDMEDDMEAEYYICMPQIYPTGSAVKTFTVTSSCSLPLKFHWEIRQPKIKGDHGEIPPGNLEVDPNDGIIKGFSEKKFDLTCKMTKAEPNIYKSVIRIIIDDLNDECLKDVDQSFVTRTSDSDDAALSVNCAEIEVWLNVVPPYITLSPCILNITSTNFQVTSSDIAVKNWGSYDVTVQWKWKRPLRKDEVLPYQITVDPKEATVEPLKEVVFSVGIYFIHPKKLTDRNIEETLVCWVNKDEVYSELLILCRISISLFNPKKITETYEFMEYTSKDLISLTPQTCDSLLKIYKEKINLINTQETQLDSMDLTQLSDLIDKHLANCFQESGLICGMAVWDGEDDVSWIIGDVKSCDIRVEPSPLYQFFFHQFHDKTTVSLINKSLITTNYRWGEPYGEDAGMLNTWMKTYSGVINPGERVNVEIFFFPQFYGEIKDFNMQCYIDNMMAPVEFIMKGLIEPLRLLLQWDTENGFYQTAWDPIENEVMKSNSLGECRLHSYMKPTPSTINSTSLQHFFNDFKLGMICSYKSGRHVLSDQENVTELSMKMHFDGTEIGSDGDYTTPPQDSYLMFSQTCSPYEYFTENIEFTKAYEKALNFKLKIGQSQKMSVNIKNLTPIKTSFSAKVELFSSMEDSPEYPLYNLFNENYTFSVLSKEWKSKIDEREKKKCGLFLDVNPVLKELNSYQDADISVTAHPDVWGDYLDVLVLRVENLPNFSVPLSIKVTGLPVSFTFDPRPEPIFRFGTLTPLETSIQNVTLKNNTFIPLKIGWTVYTKPLQFPQSNSEDENSTSSNSDTVEMDLPFSLAVDIHNPRHEFCRVELIEYLGFQQDNPYKIEPGITYLDSYSEEKINLSLEVPDFSKGGILEATCVGLIYEDPEQSARWKSLCYRPTGLNTEFFKLTLLANIEIPSLHIINIDPQDLCFMIHATRLTGNDSFTMKKEYLLKNKSKAATFITLEIEYPFEITSIHSKEGKVLTKPSNDLIFMKAHQIIRMTVVLTAYKKMLLKDEICQTGVPDENKIIISSKEARLIIRQPKIDCTQDVIFHYKLMYPFLKFSIQRIVFGPVFVNETRVKVFRITAVTGPEPISISHGEHYSPGQSPFTFSPTSSVIEKGRYLEVNVSFSPTESTGYLDELHIKSAVPNWWYVIVLEGVGTWNYKFHQIVHTERNK